MNDEATQKTDRESISSRVVREPPQDSPGVVCRFAGLQTVQVSVLEEMKREGGSRSVPSRGIERSGEELEWVMLSRGAATVGDGYTVQTVCVHDG